MISLNGINKAYKTGKYNECKAIDDISVDFDSSGIVYIIGRSGSGKTTLLNTIGGLTDVDNGAIYVGTSNMVDWSSKEMNLYRSNFVSFVFQENNLVEYLTVYENIQMSYNLGNNELSVDYFNYLMDTVNLPKEYVNKFPNELSTGEKQRVAILRAICKNSQLILADEPTGSLDSKNGKLICEELSRLSRDRLVIVISHNRDNALTYADRIIEIRDGKIISDNINCNKQLLENNNINLNNHNINNYAKKSSSFNHFIKYSLRVIQFNKLYFGLMFLLVFVAIFISLFSLNISKYSNESYFYRLMNELGYHEVQLINNGENLIYSDYEEIKNDYSDNISLAFVESTYFDSLNDYLPEESNDIGYKFLSETKFTSIYDAETDELSFEVVVGKLPQFNSEYDEIMITSLMYEYLQGKNFYEKDGTVSHINDYSDVIGLKISSNGNEAVIVGVLDTKHEDIYNSNLLYEVDDETNDEQQKIYEYLKKSHHSAYYCYGDYYQDNWIFEGNSNIVYSGENISLTEISNGQFSTMSYASVDSSYVIDESVLLDDNITYKLLPDNSVIISREVADELFDFSNKVNSNVEKGYTYEEALSIVSDSMIGQELTYSYQLGFLENEFVYMSNTNIKIVGVFSNYASDYISGLCIFSDDLYMLGYADAAQELSNISVFFTHEDSSNTQVIADFMDSTENDHIVLFNLYEEDFNKVCDVTATLVKLTFYSSVIFSLLTLIVLCFFCTILINGLYSDIGILLSLGASKKSIILLFHFIFDLFILTSFFIASICCVLFTEFLNSYFGARVNALVDIYTVNFFVFVKVFLYCCFSVSISILFPILKLRDKKPYDIIYNV